MRCEISIVRETAEAYLGVVMPEASTVLRVQYLQLACPRQALAVPPYGADAYRLWDFPNLSAQQLVRLVPELVIRGCGFQLCVDAGCVASETRWSCVRTRSRAAASPGRQTCPICGQVITAVYHAAIGTDVAFNAIRAAVFGLSLPVAVS